MQLGSPGEKRGSGGSTFVKRRNKMDRGPHVMDDTRRVDCRDVLSVLFSESESSRVLKTWVGVESKSLLHAPVMLMKRLREKCGNALRVNWNGDKSGSTDLFFTQSDSFLWNNISCWWKYPPAWYRGCWNRHARLDSIIWPRVASLSTLPKLNWCWVF